MCVWGIIQCCLFVLSETLDTTFLIRTEISLRGMKRKTSQNESSTFRKRKTSSKVKKYFIKSNKIYGQGHMQFLPM